MNFVLDASVTLSWAFDDENPPVSSAALQHLTEGEAWVPTLWSLEVTNGLLSAVKRSRIDAGSAAEFSRLLLDLPIAVDPAARRRAFESILPIARSRGLTAYDAAYLELATRMGLPVATLDARLAEAARDSGIGLVV